MPLLGHLQDCNSFRSACVYLGTPPDLKPSMLATDLAELGFCEVSFEPPVIYASAPTLAGLPSKLPRAVLCGARTPKFLNRFREIAAANGLSISPVVHNANDGHRHAGFLPSPIIVESASRAAFAKVASACDGLVYSELPSWNLLHASPTLGEFKSSRKNSFIQQPVDFLGDISWFDFKASYWIPFAQRKPLQGLFFARRDRNGISYQVGINEPPIVKLDAGGKGFDPRWAKWLVMQDNKIEALAYDCVSKRLAIPSVCPLPSHLARALALCSGLTPAIWAREFTEVPQSFPGSELRVYSEVPEVYAHILSQKLGLKIWPVPLNTLKEQSTEFFPQAKT